jgi:signal transduction histidine kinase
MGAAVEAPSKSDPSTTRRLVAWGLLVFDVLITATVAVAATRQGTVPDPTIFVIPLAFLGFAVVGAIVTTHAVGNPVGPLLMAVGFGGTVSAVAGSVWAEVQPPLPGRAWGALLAEAGSFLWIAPLTFVLYRFPDGQPLSDRWRRFERFVLACFVLTAVTGLVFPLADHDVENPIGIDAIEDSWFELVPFLGWMGSLAGIAAGAFSFVRRFRRSRGEDRARLKWVAFAAALIGVGFVTTSFSWIVAEGPESGLAAVFLVPFLGGIFFFPFAAGIGILRHRLFDIDVVISKALVFGLLAAFIAVVYVGVVVGVGAVAGSIGSPILSALAAALVALAFQPVRARARRLANRLVYGDRASPYEVLSDFSDRLGEAYSVDDVVPRMATLLGEAIGARRVRVLVRSGGELREAARWPAEPGTTAGEPPERSFEVRHQGEPLGEIAVSMPPNEPMTEPQERLVADVASQAGLVLRNAALIGDLRASRQRLVAAQDEERRRIERNIHDGAQQQLVALSVKLRLLEQLATRDGAAEAAELASELQTDAGQALEDLRDLARGIYPPLLADSGLAAALESQARKASVPVRVSSDGIGRYAPEVESAVYFCCLEALQNVGKYAHATMAEISLTATDGELAFAVSDDGAGFDPRSSQRGSGLQGMADRLEAIGGRLDVVSAPGAGTTVLGRIVLQDAV